MPFGFLQSDWDSAKEEALAILSARAANKSLSNRLITYGELASAISSIRFFPDSNVFHKFLGEISSDEDAKGRGMLSAIVVRQSDSFPGSGFFNFAKSMGKSFHDEIGFWNEQLDLVHKSWSS